MNKEKLIVILQQTIDAGIHKRTLPPWIDTESYSARLLSREVTIKNEMQELLEAHLRSEPQLQLFDVMMMNFGYGCSKVEINTLTRWLIMRSLEIGTKGAVEELETYLSLPATPGYEILAISGIELEQPIKLSNGLTLIQFSDLPDSFIKELLDPPMLKPERAASMGIPPTYSMAHKATVPKAALICKTEFSPKAYKPNSRIAKFPAFPSRQQELFETCACLTLVGPCTPLPVAHWSEIEKSVPCAELIGQSWSITTYDVLNVKNYLIKNADRTRAQKIHQIFSKLNPEIREKLRIPLERLNQAMRRQNLADKAIDLGVAFEALFLNDRSHIEQIAFTFRLRGAWFMGKDAQERQELLLFFGKLYDCRSKAVHSGKLYDKIEIKGKSPIPAQEFLEQGVKLCADSIQKVLEKGCFPEWNKVILGMPDDTNKIE